MNDIEKLINNLSDEQKKELELSVGAATLSALKIENLFTSIALEGKTQPVNQLHEWVINKINILVETLKDSSVIISNNVSKKTIEIVHKMIDDTKKSENCNNSCDQDKIPEAEIVHQS